MDLETLMISKDLDRTEMGEDMVEEALVMVEKGSEGLLTWMQGLEPLECLTTLQITMMDLILQQTCQVQVHMLFKYQ